MRGYATRHKTRDLEWFGVHGTQIESCCYSHLVELFVCACALEPTVMITSATRAQ